MPARKSVATAILTHNRPAELALLSVPNRIVVVDSGTQCAQDIVTVHGDVDYFRSEANLGGAGGFSLAIFVNAGVTMHRFSGAKMHQ